MNEILRILDWNHDQAETSTRLLTREWIVTNGLGGYASGTVSGIPTRRYHGLLVAALPAPLGRIMMLNRMAELVRLPDGTSIRLGGLERKSGLRLHPLNVLDEFRLESGLPVWRYRVGPALLEKRVLLLHHQNTTHVSYRLLEGCERIRLTVRLGLNIRPHDDPVNVPLKRPYQLTLNDDRFEIRSGAEIPPLRLHVWAKRSKTILAPGVMKNVYYRIEAGRGYTDTGEFWTPGAIQLNLRDQEVATIGLSAEEWPTFLALPPDEALAAEQTRRARLIASAVPCVREGLGAELVLAADQFLISPVSRTADATRVQAAGDEARTVIAGYHWFTDWGRDTMISLEGLTLMTGRPHEAESILRTFSHYVRDGLIPNYFPDGENEGLYHTADATLWFFHALARYVEATGDTVILESILPTLFDIVDHHRRGTRFGIGVDSSDGLLTQGAEGYQLTWMDAKVDGWVVTPRRGKAVEINALWYNALRHLESWARQLGHRAQADILAEEARRVAQSFNSRFWNEATGYLFDVVDGEGGDDPSCRPNQLFALSLTHPVLDPSRWKSVVDVARERLVTPLGLRSLSPESPDYKPRYDGDLRARDAAYHQGTVWGWLIGPFIDAWLKVYPDDPTSARGFLEGFDQHLGEAGVGTISEIFDAEAPYTPRGCIAQAWSVAEVLRCLSKTQGAAANKSASELARWL